MGNVNGANVFTPEELDALLAEEEGQATPPAEEGAQNQDGDNTNTDGAGQNQQGVDTTKAFAKRLKESTEKAIQAERLAIAKAMGFESYEALLKSRENQVYEQQGLDPTIVSPVVEELVRQRLDSDPRMKELEGYRAQQVQEFGKRELAEITKLTGGQITSLAQLPREVIDLWKSGGSLKSAYLAVEGEKLIAQVRGEQSKGTTAHLHTPNGGTGAPTGKRHLTAEEKQAWRFFNPGMTDEELNQKLVDK